MKILGISAFYHDSAAALISDGEIVAAAQEERFTRKKHDSGFPRQAVDFCLRQAGTPLAGVDRVVFYDKPFLKFERLLETYLAFAPRGVRSFRMAMPLWVREKLFGGPARRPDEPLTGRHMDLAASVQRVLEEIVLRITRSLAAETGIGNLCLAGGVALNCVANGRILRDGAFRNLWIQPAAGDAGGALGAALAAYHSFAAQPRAVSSAMDSMKGAYLGPEFPQAEIEKRLRAAGARFHVLDDETLLSACTEELTAGAALGWFQGRMEFGPRALGARSILADARSPKTQSLLNLKVKFRESFRPFAPSVLRERVADWFELDGDSPYMLLVANVREDHRIPMTPEQEALFGIDKLNVPRSDIPAVTHVDYSARIQTVHQATNPRYYALLQKFYQRTGCPVIVNTSFNVRGEPIVCTPEDAFHCFMGTNMEALAAGNCFLRKSEQDASLAQQYQSKFDLD